MSVFGKLFKAGLDVARLPVAVMKDVATLGGSINGSWFKNGGHTFTGRVFEEIGEDIQEAKDEL